MREEIKDLLDKFEAFEQTATGQEMRDRMDYLEKEIKPFEVKGFSIGSCMKYLSLKYEHMALFAMRLVASGVASKKEE